MLGRVKDIEKTTAKRVVKELHLIDVATDKEFTAIGPVLDAIPGSCLKLKGLWVKDVFKFTEAESASSCKKEEAAKLLSYNLSLTEEQAAAVAEITIEGIPDGFTEKLIEISGIGPVKADRIARAISNRKDKEKLLKTLTSCGAKEDVILKCFSDTSITVGQIFKNPYLLIDYGESFLTCDKMARLKSFAQYSDNRIHGAIKYVMIRQEAAGNTKAAEEAICKQIKLLSEKENAAEGIPPTLSEIYAESDEMLSINEDLTFSFAKTSEYELKIAENMLRLASAKEESDVKQESYIREAEKELGVTYSEEQRDAFSILQNGGVKLLTGGPGTGKTLTIAGIVKSYIAYHPEKKVLLCAPTGRAAARMKELAGDNASASTIHKALGLSHFMKGKPEVLDYDLIICDEMSMADTELMALFLSVIKSKTRVLLAGDYRQLPSVGPGRVFKDLIESRAFEITILTKVTRQKEGSSIPVNAARVLNGMLPETQADFDIFYFRNDEEIKKATDSLKYVDKTLTLCPLRRGEYGSEAIARKIQETRDFDSRPVFVRFDSFHDGDLVLMNKNNYDAGYINGDIGIISHISLDKCNIEIGDKLLTIKAEDFSDMSLAYCMTVHKSQGSESDNVDVILPEAAGNLLSTREILYTAITRAKKRVRIFTTKKALTNAVNNEMVSKRYCGLKEKILRLA